MVDEGGGNLGRNFRSAYYEKLGFSGNEEKNILDLLLSSSSFDLEKLSDLSERFDIDRRCVDAWKVLLEVECGRKNPFDEFANVRRVREEHFQSLKHHLEVLLRHNLVIKKRLKQGSRSSAAKPLEDHKHLLADENCCDDEENSDAQKLQKSLAVPDNSTCYENNKHSANNIKAAAAANEPTIDTDSIKQQKPTDQSISPTSPTGQIVLMYLLEMGRIDYSDIDAQLNSLDCRKLAVRAMFFVNISRDLQEAFFLFRNFTKKLEENEANPSNNKSSQSTLNNKKALIL